MSRLFLFLCGIASVSSMANGIQTIQVDDEHLQFERVGGEIPPFYSVHAASSLELDATGYEFYIPPQLAGKHPNVIQLVLGKNQRYVASWVEGQTRYLLSSTTLSVLPGSTAFHGFTPGVRGVIAIGHFEGNDFGVLWAGMFNVK